MKKSDFRQFLKDRVLILDGVFGTMLQPHLPAGACVDAANLEKPDLVEGIIRDYVSAGADIISTNTFGASRIKLDEFSQGEKTREINETAAKLAKKHAGKCLVAGVIGPTGKLVQPLGDMNFDEAYKVFKEQALALAEGGVDLFLLETFSDLKEIKAAMLAIHDLTDLPVMAAMTFGDSYITFTGTDPVTAANVLISMGADALGVNCSTGPEPMLEVLGRYAVFTDHPLFIEPNAGIPRLNGKAVKYQVTADEMAVFAEKFVQIGANVVGTCCGSTPEYTQALRKKLNGMKPVSRKANTGLHLSSRVHTVSVGSDLPFAIIGERINPTNRDDLADAILHGKIGPLQQEARAQTEEGAHLLDVNIGVPGVDEAGIMLKAVQGIENVSRLPLVIDSTNVQAIETALKESAGKPLINSVHGSKESMKGIIPLAAKYGAGLLCLAVGEKGIPNTAEERLQVLDTIIRTADKAGIPKNHLICDCLTLTVSAQQKRAETTLRAIQMVKEKLNLPTILGVSNISYGLPERGLINATFLSMAMASGLDAAIINPGDAGMMNTVRAASVLTVRDKDSRAFVSTHQKKKGKKTSAVSTEAKTDSGEKIYDAVASGRRDDIAELIEEALKSGISALDINNDMISAIQEVGRQYDAKTIFLPQMIMAAETMQRGFVVLEPHFAGDKVQSRGKVILCTVKGDVHDIGKNIVGLFLRNHGFDVIDLGKDVPTEHIVEEAVKKKADVVGLSALMTTTMQEMKNVIQALKKAKSGARIIIGGAVVTKKYAADIGAHAYAKDAVSAVEQVKSLVQ